MGKFVLRGGVAALCLLAFPLPALGQAGLAPATPSAARPAAQAPAGPPAFRPDRTAEDYSFLRNPARRGDWSDAYKFIPLDATGRSYLSMGGEVRERAELFDAPRFGIGGAGDDAYLLQRVLVHGDLHLGDHVRVFAQIGAHEAIGKAQVNAPDEDQLDIHQLFLELRATPQLSGRFGRQEMYFNPLQRFVSFRDGTNVRQTFDGGRVTVNQGPVRIDAFLTSPVTIRRELFDNSRNRDQLFGGLYVSRRLGPNGRGSLDGYYFLLDREDVVLGGARGETRHNVGLHYAGARSGFDWDGEALYQFGDSVGRDIGAWAVSADLGYTIEASRLKPRFGLRFDAGSGDGDPNDGELGSFYPLFPAGPYFNEANLTSWTNLLAVRPSLRIQASRRLSLLAAVQLKWREDVRDAVYVGPSTPLAATRGNQEREIGQVYTIDANYQLNRNFAFRAYYLRHTAGPALSLAGGRDVDFVMGSVTLRF